MEWEVQHESYQAFAIEGNVVTKLGPPHTHYSSAVMDIKAKYHKSNKAAYKVAKLTSISKMEFIEISAMEF